jgi:hypothetical protein
MDKSWWASAVQWAIWGVLMALVMGWLARSRLKKRPAVEARRLEHPKSTLIVGLVTFLFFAAIAVISNVWANKTTTWWTTAVFVGFALLGLYVVAEYLRARHEVAGEGMAYSRLFGPRGHLRWSDLRRVAYAPTMKWFRLETRSGDVARISAMLIGLPEFARLLLAHAPAGVIDPDALQILQATAAGNPPSVWG